MTDNTVKPNELKVTIKEIINAAIQRADGNCNKTNNINKVGGRSNLQEDQPVNPCGILALAKQRFFLQIFGENKNENY